MSPFGIFEPRPDHSPFREWKCSDIKGVTSEFFNLPGHPDVVVRKFSEFGLSFGPRKLTQKEALEYWATRAKALQGFAAQYGIRTAKTQYFFGNDPYFKGLWKNSKDESPALMAVTERITGENLEEIESMDENAFQETENFFVGVFSNIRDSYRENGYYWGDAGAHQAMYGTSPGETEKHVYIIDMDPRMIKWDEEPAEKKEYNFWRELYFNIGSMKHMEHKMREHRKRFEKAREILSKIIAEMPVPEEKLARTKREGVLEKLQDGDEGK